MEVKMKDRFGGKGVSGMMKSVGAMYQRIAKISAKASEVDAAGFAHAGASKEYQAYHAKVASARARAVADVRGCAQSRC